MTSGTFRSLRPRRLLAGVLGLAAVAVVTRVGGRILGPSVPAYLGIASATLATILLVEGLLRLRGGWRKLFVSIGIVGPLVLLTASFRIGLD